MDNIKIIGEWYFEHDGIREGPFFNFITTDGLAQIAELLKGASSPYLVVGDDTTSGETITEIFRKAVSTVTRTGNMVRFRTQLLTSECNGNHNKACIYLNGSATAGTGTMFNLLLQAWTKTVNTTLTVECKITVS